MAGLQQLWVRYNQFTGSVPAELAGLQFLYLEGNQLTGCIPTELRDIPDNDFSLLGLNFCDGSTPDALRRRLHQRRLSSFIPRGRSLQLSPLSQQATKQLNWWYAIGMKVAMSGCWRRSIRGRRIRRPSPLRIRFCGFGTDPTLCPSFPSRL